MADTMNFAPEFDAPIDYMRRTRDYYIALGYDNPYRWAHYVDAPFTPLERDVNQAMAKIEKLKTVLGKIVRLRQEALL